MNFNSLFIASQNLTESNIGFVYKGKNGGIAKPLTTYGSKLLLKFVITATATRLEHQTHILQSRRQAFRPLLLLSDRG